jgi:hypothetical protein
MPGFYFILTAHDGGEQQRGAEISIFMLRPQVQIDIRKSIYEYPLSLNDLSNILSKNF